MKSTPSPVTVMVTRRAKPGQQAAFEEFLQGIIRAAMQFEGHRGASVFPPTEDEKSIYRIVFKFDTPKQLRRWETSEEHRYWYDRAEPISEGEPIITQHGGLGDLVRLEPDNVAPASL